MANGLENAIRTAADRIAHYVHDVAKIGSRANACVFIR
jgi:hypothetical protein